MHATNRIAHLFTVPLRILTNILVFKRILVLYFRSSRFGTTSTMRKQTGTSVLHVRIPPVATISPVCAPPCSREKIMMNLHVNEWRGNLLAYWIREGIYLHAISACHCQHGSPAL